jgi:uncharacterized integral membrane protein (TIGR00698 family)
MKVSVMIYVLAMVLCTMPFVETPIALLAGIVLVQFIQHPFPKLNKKLTKYLLQASVVGLGFGMNIWQAASAGKEGLFFTIFSIITTIGLGWYIGWKLHIEKPTSFLISSGTAICGGSAIAAISPIVKASEKQITTALGIVFVLNSIALFIFPQIGHSLHMSQHQFGVWAAIAIHDTSSVVGAAHQYGNEALQIATTIKLERALWIIPLAILSIFIFKSDSKKIKIPYFIFLFIAAIVLNTFLPGIHFVSPYITTIARTGLKISLFLIGTTLTKDLIFTVGFKPFLQGILIWVFISVLSLITVLHTIA